MPIKETDRAEFEAFGDLGFDKDGCEVLVGLTYEETEWYLDVLERDRSGRGHVTGPELDMRSKFDDRHATVRLMLAQAADEARFKARRTFLLGPVDDHAAVADMHPGAMALSNAARDKGKAT